MSELYMFNQIVEHRPDDHDQDAIFQALTHPIRRDPRGVRGGTAADRRPGRSHDVSLAAVFKHVGTLEDAGLVDIAEDVRIRRCHLNAPPLGDAYGWLTRYRVFWEDRFDALAILFDDEDDT